MKLSDVLSALGLAPKNLAEAHAALTPAKATLDSVAALFTAAGLDLETMLAAGPESLKAHIDSLGEDDEVLAEALLENERLEKELATSEALRSSLAAAGEQASLALASTLATLGLNASGPADTLTPDAVKAALDAHIKKQATIALAKTGHPTGVAQVVEVPAAQLMKRAEWEKLPNKEKADFFNKGGRLTD